MLVDRSFLLINGDCSLFFAMTKTGEAIKSDASRRQSLVPSWTDSECQNFNGYKQHKTNLMLPEPKRTPEEDKLKRPLLFTFPTA